MEEDSRVIDIDAAEEAAYVEKQDRDAAFEEREHFAYMHCQRCGEDISELCGVLEMQVPVGKDRMGRVMMAVEILIERPLICPHCRRSTAAKPSKILPGGSLAGI